MKLSDLKKSLKPGERASVRRGIYVYMTIDGRFRYGISYFYAGRIYKKIVGNTIRDAEKALSIRHAEIARGEFKIPTPHKSPTFGDFADRYIEYAKTNKTSWKHDEYLLVTPRTFFEGALLSHITRWRIEQFKAMRRKTVGPRAVNAGVKLLRRMFNLAIDWGVLNENPTRGVRLLREVERPMRLLSAKEEDKLLDAAPKHIRQLTLFALNTGMRRAEILRLKWERVKLDLGYIQVGETKSGKVRNIPISDELRDVFRRQPFGEYVFTWAGKPYTRFDKTWIQTVKDAGIKPIRFHDLRHTYATSLVALGVDLVVIQELLGHASIETTRRYTHATPERKKDAVERLDRFRAATKLARRNVVEITGTVTD